MRCWPVGVGVDRLDRSVRALKQRVDLIDYGVLRIPSGGRRRRRLVGS